MEFSHIPVLPDESIEKLNICPEGIYVDGTLGGAGHAGLICEKLSEEGVFVGIDRDLDALEVAKKRLENHTCEKHFAHSNYSEIKKVLQEFDIDGIDGALLDIGVSSYQLDEAERGFSYMNDAPLDMRMNRDSGFSAYDVVNRYTEKELHRIIKEYGEERWAKRIAQFIIAERKEGPVETTGQLVSIIKKAIPKKARIDGPHPAKRTFQAIRIEVNDELGGLERAVTAFMDVLNPGGRLAIITFHSLEDRIVKEAFRKRENPCTCPPEFPICVCGKVGDVKRITGKPVTASEDELEENPRSRSAKLRVIEKVR